MDNRASFVQKKIQCPVCFVSVPLIYPNPKIYSVTERDMTNRPVTYRWLEGHDSSIQPHYYAVWQCPQCKFAAFYEHILNPKGDREFYLREGFKKLEPEGMLFLDQLYSLEPKGEYSLAGAISKHLSALYITSLPEEEHKDHNRLARLNLRLSWLYSEALEGGSDEAAPIVPPALEEIGACVAQLPENLSNFHELVLRLRAATEKRGKEIVNRHYGGIVREFALKLNDLMNLTNTLKQSFQNDEQEALEELSRKASSNGKSLAGGLARLKTGWTDMPMTENQALQDAVAAFEYAMFEEKGYSKIEQAMGVVQLIVSLKRKLGDKHGALQTITRVSRGGVSSKQDLTQKFRKLQAAGMADSASETALRGKLSRLDESINALAEARQQIIDEMLAEQAELIIRLTAAAPKKTEDALVDALKTGGISDMLISTLRNRGWLRDKGASLQKLAGTER